ncbi:phosphoenolpyruvate carboxykinase [Erysipelotrichaceae bacterium OttesenSCG-928-M19]|nr:phosphoenolpyruvate carboxykinase [Erysipelotrichaceae bacterium OttesenSCG-928-M19]
MAKSFTISHTNAVLNFTKYYCTSSVELLDSRGFKKVVEVHLLYLKRKGKPLYYALNKIEPDDSTLVDELVTMFKLLLVMDLDEVKKVHKDYIAYIKAKDSLLEFVETMYNYWRSLERYALVYNNKSQKGIQNAQFIQSHSDFESLILETYRKVSETIMGKKNRVYRQLIAGVNAGIVVNEYRLNCEQGIYEVLRPIPIIEAIILHPPFITYPRRNTRDGIFKEVFENPIKDVEMDKNDFLCYPAKVGKFFALIYFHKDFMSMGVTLANLFELADLDTVKFSDPDMIYVFGVKDEVEKTCFYHDSDNDLFVGYASYSDEFDYFGYMKKMILTLHNVKGINQGGLPIHGAMAVITMDNNETKNIVIMGDSGAGKSETLEALRTLEDNGIRDIKIIFDDMGIIFDEDDKIKAYGTEIGAFVRLDDLDTGYAYRTIDRSIFMNPDKINARIVIPVATYEEITKGYEIDLFLYANNYDDDNKPVEIFNDLATAKQVFIDGARLAKGTTQEVGLVKSYFANPFGPVQRQEQTDPLIDKYFKMFFDQGIRVGQLKTKLGIKGYETSGPKAAAIELLKFLNK